MAEKRNGKGGRHVRRQQERRKGRRRRQRMKSGKSFGSVEGGRCVGEPAVDLLTKLF